MNAEPEYENKLHIPAGPQIQDRWKHPLRKDEPKQNQEEPMSPTQTIKQTQRMSPQEAQKITQRSLDAANGELDRLREARTTAHTLLEEAKKHTAEASEYLKAARESETAALNSYQRTLEAEAQAQGRISQLQGQLSVSVGRQTGGVSASGR